MASLAPAMGQAAPAVDDHHALAAQEQSVVAAFLAHDRYLRLATRDDCRCDRAISAQRSGAHGIPDYEPFVASGDFNGDGRADLAVLFYNRDPYVFAPGVLAIFNGPLSANEAPAFVRGDVPLEQRGLFVSAPNPHRLSFGRFDGSGCTYRPFGRGYREDCSSP